MAGTAPNKLAEELKKLGDRVLVIETEFKAVKSGIRSLQGLTGTVLASVIAAIVLHIIFKR
jgi:hypothetical protein